MQIITNSIICLMNNVQFKMLLYQLYAMRFKPCVMYDRCTCRDWQNLYQTSYCSYRLRSENKLVVIVASTGIAAIQLPGGWTAHSMFKLPFEDANVSGCVCNIAAESQRAEVLRKSDLII